MNTGLSNTGSIETGSVNTGSISTGSISTGSVSTGSVSTGTRTLMVTPFAPYRDGIATYAAQEIRARRADGEHIEVVSPMPSAANHHLPLGGVRGATMLINLARNYQRVVVQFGPELLFGRCRSAAQRMSVWSAVIALARLVPLEFRIHEIEYQAIADNPGERRLLQLLLRMADQVTVHTAPERELLRPLLGDDAADRIEVIDHGRNFVPAVVCSTEQAKLELGLPADEFSFVSIGFIQHHKGFDRAVEAFSLARLAHASLHVVGSGRIDHPEIGAYVAELADMCWATDGAELHNRFVSDDQFDLWLQAADAVVLPYREIWSSSVVERARLFDKPIIASDLDQLRHQLGDGDYACPDVEQLAVAMEKVWSSSLHARLAVDDGAPRRRATDRLRPSAEWDVNDNSPNQAAIQAQVIARASGRSGGPSPTSNPVAGGTDRRPNAPTGPVGQTSPQSARGIALLGSLDRPEPVSARPGVAPAKHAVQRATSWQLDPMYQRIRELQQATLDAVVEVEARLTALEQTSDARYDEDHDG